MHIFFDSTEVVAGGKGSAPALGRIGDQRLRKVASALGADLYVPELVVVEASFRRWRHIQEQISRAKTAAEAVKPYATIQVIDEPLQEVLLAKFREELERMLREIPVTIIPTSVVTLDEVLKLSTRRIPPFAPPDDPRGFHDAVILLCVLKYAQANHLSDIVFVSEDQDHKERAIQEIATDYGTRCELVRLTDAVVERMEHLRTAHLASMQDTAVKRATEFMNRHRSLVQDFLMQHPLALKDVGAHLFGVTEVLGISVAAIEAIPEKVPSEGEECRLSLFVKAVVDVIAQRAGIEVPSYTFTQGGMIATTPPMSGIFTSTGESAVPISRTRRDLELRGEATAKFKQGDFVAPPIVRALRPYRQWEFGGTAYYTTGGTDIQNTTSGTTWSL